MNDGKATKGKEKKTNTTTKEKQKKETEESVGDGKADNGDAQWFRTAKNPDVSTGPLARPFDCSLAPLTRSLAPDCSLCSRPPLHLLVCSLAHFAHTLARGTVIH